MKAPSLTSVPITLALALIGMWMAAGTAEGSECLQKILPPAAVVPVLENNIGKWGSTVLTPNELTMAVLSVEIDWTGGTSYTGGLWIYRRANTSVDFELIQTIGNGTIMQTVTTAFGAGDYIVVGGRLNADITVNNYTVLLYDDATELYVVDQILDGGAGYQAATNARGAMCSEWAFAVFENADASVISIFSFYRNPDTTSWVKHGTIMSLASADSGVLIGVGPSCTRLVIKQSVSPSTFFAYKYSLSDNNWIEVQNWPTPSAGRKLVVSMAVGDTRLYTGMPNDIYNMTAENQPTNPNNLTFVTGAGAVAEYLFNGTHFLLEKEQMFQRTPGENAGCGRSVALGANTLVVGCPTYNTTYSFADQCEDHPTVCNVTTCAVSEDSWSTANSFLFIRGRIDQYALNSETSEFDFSTVRDEVCNSSLPWLCGTSQSGGSSYASLYGTAVATVNDEVFVSSPADWTVGQVYVYGDTIECDKCPCKTDPPCQNGGVCRDLPTAPFFFCTCPANYTGSHCAEPVPVTESSQPSVWNAYGPITGFAVAAGVVAIVLLVVFAVKGAAAGGKGAAAAAATGKKGGHGRGERLLK